jgi:hypothetical protein
VDGSNGVYLYTPTGGFPSQSFNASNYWVDVVFTTTVTSANQAPSAISDSYSMNEDAVFTAIAPGVLSNDSDPELNPITAMRLSDPANGQLTFNADGSFVYTPALNFNGTVSFTYRTSDGALTSDIATVAIAVNAVNDPPSANNQSVATIANTPLPIALVATDVDLNPLQYNLVAPPAHGSLSGTMANVTYTPAADYTGLDSFTFTANDGQADSNVATVFITVNVPAPIITTISPAIAAAGDPAFTLIVTGTNFVSSSIVRWNGADRTTTFVSSTRLQASIPASDLATAGMASLTVFNPTPGGGTSNAATFAINNPVPTLSAISPSTAVVGSSAITLIITGTNFVSSSIVRWNGADRTTTFVSSTRLQASIPASDLTSAGTANVTVFNPAPGGGTSNAATFAINNPVPAVSALGPNIAVQEDPAFTLIVTGTNFVNGAVVRWNGANRTTTFVSSTRLQVSIPASDLTTTGTASVTVFNPTPGGGTSNALSFSIAANQLANPRFELDANGDSRPDSWTSLSQFTRSSAAVHGGAYSGRHFAANNSSYNIQQLVSGLSGGRTYAFVGWTNIPATSDTFTYRLMILWRNSAGSTLRTDTVKTYTASTNGVWNQAAATLVAPGGTASAYVRMEVTSLNATIYADDFTLR